jgi:malate dehydrogenase (quinone)
MKDFQYDVVIIGAGITGSALSYELARYSDIKNIAIIEKYGQVGSLNSNSKGNSQTIHMGDIETNFSLTKSYELKKIANMVVKYCLMYGYEKSIMHSYQKMVMGVGDKEVELIKKRYKTFLVHFPYLKLWDRKDLEKIEPNVIFDKNGNVRKDNILAMGTKDVYSAVDYGQMAITLIENAKKEKGKRVDLFLNCNVVDINKQVDNIYKIICEDKIFYSKVVVVNAGAHSLFLAHKMGYGSNYSSLPMAGSFYKTNKNLLNGKVYMVQNNKLPFAALHGDPDITNNNITRFGPTAIILPKLERFKVGTFWAFWKTLNMDKRTFSVIVSLIKDIDIRHFIIKNILYEIPFISKIYFLKSAKKIIPSLEINDIYRARGFGGIRPQIIDKVSKTLITDEISIDTKEGLIFNMIPSTGASSCMGIGIRDTKSIVKYLDAIFYEEKFDKELVD